MIEIIIAKTRPQVETLKEHTDALIERYHILKEVYGTSMKERIWELLYKAVLYHDVGKVNNHFQSQMYKALQIDTKKESSEFGHIPHNYLSPLFLPITNWDLNKKEKQILIQAIAYHHERKSQPDEQMLRSIYEKELTDHFPKLKREMNLELPKPNQKLFHVTHFLKQNKRIKELDDFETYYNYILIKGLLHRLDHAASAHVEIEIDGEVNISELTKNYMDSKFGENSLRPLQKFTYQNQEKNLIIVAQTGMGKTEASLLWAGKDKTFFTLPIRVSLNALYNRVYDEMDYRKVGLLHGSSSAHLDEHGVEQWEIINDQSRNFANKLLFTTVDQVLKFPFKYKGYEKMFATMAYSKVIIDEIQAYDPWMVAVIIRAIEMIHRLGGKFMIMTATLPQIYLDELRYRNIIDDNCLYETFTDEEFIRHRISLKKKSILKDSKNIEELAKNKKVLVIVNTVDRAIELYQLLENANLLHSRFIQKDRRLLEQEIKRFADTEGAGIWITTQLVEASIDIDFDVLCTELSTIDSLLQRFGRCYRKRMLDHSSPNINIYTEDISGEGSVYNRDILSLTLDELHKYDGQKVNEKEKVEMVKYIYSKETLANTKFYEDFKNAVRELKNIEDYQYTENEAQKRLRNIDSIRVIPRTIYDSILHLFEKLENEMNAHKRTKIRRTIEQHIVSIPRNKYSYSFLAPIDFYRTGKDGRKYNLLPNVFVLDIDYDFDVSELKGVGLSQSELKPLFL